MCVLCSCVSKKLSMYLHRLCIAVKLTRLRYPKCIHLSLGIILVSNIPIPTQRLMLVVKFGVFFEGSCFVLCPSEMCSSGLSKLELGFLEAKSALAICLGLRQVLGLFVFLFGRGLLYNHTSL